MTSLKTLKATEQCLSVADFVVQVVSPESGPVSRSTDIVIHTVGLNRIGLPDIVLLVSHNPNQATVDVDTYKPVVGPAIIGLYQAAKLIAKTRQSDIIIGNATGKLVFSKLNELTPDDDVWFRRLRYGKLMLLDELYSGETYDVVIYKAKQWVS